MDDNYNLEAKKQEKTLQERILEAQLDQLVEMNVYLKQIEKYARLFYILALIAIVLCLIFFVGNALSCF